MVLAGKPQVNMETIKIYDDQGAEITPDHELLSKLLKQHCPEWAIVKSCDVVNLLRKTQELNTIVQKSVEVIVIFHDIIGNKYPTSVAGAAAMMPKIANKLINHPEIIDALKERILVINEIAPAHLAPELLQKIQAFTPKQLPNG